jgi:cell division ATPase FtsA
MDKVVPVGGSIITTKLSYKGALTVIGIVEIVQYMFSRVFRIPVGKNDPHK